MILIVAAAWHDEAPGGANKLPTDFARYLARHGEGVVYLCAQAGPDRALRDEIDGVEIWRYVPRGSRSLSLPNLWTHVTAPFGLARKIARERGVRAVLGHAPLQYLGAAAACGSGVRRCYAVHSPFAHELRANHHGRPTLRHRAAWGLASLIERNIYAWSHVIHCDSAYTLGLIQPLLAGSARTRAIHLAGWVDAGRFTPAALTAEGMRANLGPPWDPATMTFFTLRRLAPRMGVDTLLDAAAILAGEGRPFRLVIGGGGPELAALRSRARALGLDERVAFLGRVPDESLVDTFRAADCFVLPTRTLEGFGLIILEAFACGTPVIGVPVGAITEVMGADFRDWVTDDSSAEGLAAKMRAFLTGELRTRPRQLRARALEFDLDVVAERHRHVLLGERDAVTATNGCPA